MAARSKKPSMTPGAIRARRRRELAKLPNIKTGGGILPAHQAQMSHGLGGTFAHEMAPNLHLNIESVENGFLVTRARDNGYAARSVATTGMAVVMLVSEEVANYERKQEEARREG